MNHGAWGHQLSWLKHNFFSIIWAFLSATNKVLLNWRVNPENTMMNAMICCQQEVRGFTSEIKQEKSPVNEIRKLCSMDKMTN